MRRAVGRPRPEPPAFVVKYLNRLSDYLFTLARFLDHKNGGIEIIWKSEK
jgi:cob(I)alamin adenosyltransferase